MKLGAGAGPLGPLEGKAAGLLSKRPFFCGNSRERRTARPAQSERNSVSIATSKVRVRSHRYSSAYDYADFDGILSGLFRSERGAGTQFRMRGD